MTDSEAMTIVRGVLGKGLSADQAEQMVSAMVPMTVTPGAIVLSEEEKPKGLLVLLSGTVEILKQTPGGELQPLLALEAPTVLGEVSLITDREPTATVRAKTACEFRLLTKRQFDRLIQSESLAAYKVMHTLAEVLARRLHRMDEKVLELTQRHGASEPVEELARFKQKLFSEWSF